MTEPSIDPTPAEVAALVTEVARCTPWRHTYIDEQVRAVINSGTLRTWAEVVELVRLSARAGIAPMAAEQLVRWARRHEEAPR